MKKKGKKKFLAKIREGIKIGKFISRHKREGIEKFLIDSSNEMLTISALDAKDKIIDKETL